MSCIVYREGKGTIEHGIECEAAYIEVDQLDAHLASGWSVNPPGFGAEAEGDEEDSLDETRAAAKAAGIDGWDTKRIKTLKAALDSLEKE